MKLTITLNVESDTAIELGIAIATIIKDLSPTPEDAHAIGQELQQKVEEILTVTPANSTAVPNGWDKV